MEFGDQIKELRKRNSLTQDELADKLHVTRQAVSNWENDRNLPDLEMLIDISREFHEIFLPFPYPLVQSRRR